jgi:hypothetical protein
MKEIRNEIEIQASPETVWKVLTDLKAYAEWNPQAYRGEGQVELGQEVKVSVRSATRDMDLSCKVVRVEPDREFALKFHIIHPFLFRGEHIFRLEPVGEHSVRFIDREIFAGLLVLVPVVAKDIETNTKAAMIEVGEALKKRVEQHKIA